MPMPTPENTIPARWDRPSAASQPRPQALVATSVQALVTPARKRSTVHAGSAVVHPTAAVMTTVDTRPAASSVADRTRTRAAASAPTR
jgi:hypothetical protein